MISTALFIGRRNYGALARQGGALLGGGSLSKAAKPFYRLPACIRNVNTVKADDLDVSTNVHFRVSGTPHPLNAKGDAEAKKFYKEIAMADHTGRQQNHIWSAEELHEKMSTLYRHKPVTFSDHVMNKLMYGLYHTFNFITGYKAVDPSVNAIEWRLLVLESIAGVPGFVAAGVRHFRSLRLLRRDYGWITTLLEEAENERMHLLICMNTFEASPVTRAFIIAAQMVMVPFLMGVYLVHPKSMHRFVGYLEETACMTYVNVIKHIETPGTNLHKGWSNKAAPPIAIGYYHLSSDAKWVDSLKCMMADEANHRDVNHTFADMKSDDPNPFLAKHKEDAFIAWRLSNAGEQAWDSPATAAEVEALRQQQGGGKVGKAAVSAAAAVDTPTVVGTN